MKRLFILLSILFLSVQVLFSQQNKKETERLKKSADLLFEYNSFKKALEIYQVLYKSDSLNGEINFKVGVCIYYLGNEKKDAIPYFERAAFHDQIDSYYYLGCLYHLNAEFEKALSSYNQYRNQKGEKSFVDYEIERQISITRNAKERIKKPINVQIENMGPVINSLHHDYAPLISADGNLLIFTSRRESSTGGLLDPYEEYFEDIYISRKVENEWTEPKGISHNINSSGHDASVTLTADGEKLFIYRTNQSLTGGDIYESKYDGSDWTKPEKLEPDINSVDGWESSASISQDSEIFYFSSNRPGGYGGKDIYRVVKLPNGLWSKASNLGSAINTAFDDDAPFIHPDGKTLYFSSKGHNTMGGYDIFKTIKDENGWSTPENIGYPINSVEDDIYFVLTVNGDVGYYASKKASGIGKSDIYKVFLPDENFDLAVLKGSVHNKDKLPLSATITLIDEEYNSIHGMYNSNRLTGKFIMIIKPGKTYRLIVESPGYNSFSDIVGSHTPIISLKLIETK
ncbi:MAG: PD40 domain-containing protein [Bacteroidetes bacterium]|nr:PD40 domain-containing protein [Bacteroidota bacterium]HET6243596.1 hypothetical protein [Bacteroidia bacterium]